MNDQALLLEQRKAWEAEKSKLETALKNAQRRPAGREAAPAAAPATPDVIEVVKKFPPKETLEELVHLKLRPGANQTKLIRQVIQHCENLVDAGPAALPAIREFLAKNLEFDYEEDTDEIRSGWRDGRINTDFLLAPSLRLGLLNVVRRIGGPEAEQILADVVTSSGRGVEVAYASRLLEEMAPNKYRAAAVTAARELLTNPLVAKDSSSHLDRLDRTWLFGLRGTFKDPSMTSLAQSQLIREDGKLDFTALRYIKDVLQADSLPIWQQAYADSRLDPKQKEPLVQFVLAFAGVDARADTMLATIFTDPTLPKGIREEAVHGLSNAGLEDRKNPTEHDLQLLATRAQMVASLRASTTDKQFANELDKSARRITEVITGTREKKVKDSQAAALGVDVKSFKVKKPE